MHRAILGKGRYILDGKYTHERNGKGSLICPGVTGDMQHTIHCETMLLRRQEVPYDAMNTIVSIKYPDCGA
jgi:hypothetical protein